jgi:hypothetical protein
LKETETKKSTDVSEKTVFSILGDFYIKNEGSMIVQSIDTDLPGNTALPHRRQIPLQNTEFSSRGIEKGK